MKKLICLVAILKEEEPFLDEWILYHKMIGIDHFYLYDDDPSFPLSQFLKPHSDYVTVINWHDQDKLMEGRMNQTKAYTHSVDNFAKNYKWVTFIDADEFIVLRQHENIKDFLSGFEDYNAVSLNWHVFGHNGHYDDPQGLITSSLTRRMFLPSENIKTISRSEAIVKIDTPHFCRLKPDSRVDANKHRINTILYPGRTDVAHINHYQCRSFKNWMGRVKRGDVNFNSGNCPKEHSWRLMKEKCLKHFVRTVALNKNEYVDEYMVKYKTLLEEAIKKINR